MENQAQIISNEWKAYKGLNKSYNHHIVNHSKKRIRKFTRQFLSFNSKQNK